MAMKRSEVLYQVCDVAPGGDWEPIGLLHSSKTEAEQDLRNRRRHYPTVILVRVVMARCDETSANRHLQAVQG